MMTRKTSSSHFYQRLGADSHGKLLEMASVRRDSFRPPCFTAYYPKDTMSVSVTGKKCALNCSHCGGHYLLNMVDIKDLEENLKRKRPKSILLSGGCGPMGNVPSRPFVEEIKRLNYSLGLDLRINAHPGVVNADDARFLSNNVEAISFDFIFDDDAIKEALHGAWTKEDYMNTFRALNEGKAKVVPHVLLGLNKGRIVKEYDAIDYLVGQNVTQITFIVFIPTPGTLWQDLNPPPIDEVSDVLAYARIVGKGVKITLGCMRPKGKYRQVLDKEAVLAGVDGIVLPSKESLALAQAKGLSILKREECCAFE